MAAIAGQSIGLAATVQPNIAGTQAKADSGTTGRGCTTNFIGFGKGLTSLEPTPVDFTVAEEAVALCAPGTAEIYDPTYGTAANGAAALTWVLHV